MGTIDLGRARHLQMKKGIDHVYIRQIGVNCKDLAITEQADCGKVLIEDQVSSPGRVVQRQRDTMLTKENVLEREGQSITHDELGPLNDYVYKQLTKDGIPRFELLQRFQQKPQGTLLYYVFDLPYLGGKDLTALPLLRRGELLKNVLPEN